MNRHCAFFTHQRALAALFLQSKANNDNSMKTVVRITASLALCVLWASDYARADHVALCSISPSTYTSAKTEYPKYKVAIEQLENRGIATWYTDREGSDDHTVVAKRLVEACDDSTRLTTVVYGLPNKDCEAGYSSGGGNKDSEDYETFIGSLADIVGDRKALYILEPDAVGLLGNGEDSCAEKYGYLDNLMSAIRILSKNSNADIYLDVGFWRLATSAKADAIAKIVRNITSAGRVKGITLNTSNYQGTNAMVQMCNNFQTAYGSKDLGCIIDTSRNYNGYTGEEWCNVRSGGIGHPPTSNTGIDNIDYFVWVKPPGESDGECDGEGHTSDAMVGPSAGSFFAKEFELLWNQGYFVKEEGMAQVGSKSGVSTGAIVGICFGVVAAIVLVVGGIWFKRRQSSRPVGSNFAAVA